MKDRTHDHVQCDQLPGSSVDGNSPAGQPASIYTVYMFYISVISVTLSLAAPNNALDYRANRLMPGFQHSVAILPLPFRCAVVRLLFFRSVATVAVAGENGNAGNVFPYA